MTVTIDKFGRVLIPKKVRDEAGIEDGTEFDLLVESVTNTIIFKPLPKASPKIEYTDWGWPVIVYPTEESLSFDLKAFIEEGHEERGRRLTGLDD